MKLEKKLEIREKTIERLREENDLLQKEKTDLEAKLEMIKSNGLKSEEMAKKLIVEVKIARDMLAEQIEEAKSAKERYENLIKQTKTIKDKYESEYKNFIKLLHKQSKKIE